MTSWSRRPLKPPPPASVAARQSQIEPFLAASLTAELEPLILRQRDRDALALALQRARRGIHIGISPLADALVDRNQGPGALRGVVQEAFVTPLFRKRGL